jgi:hypothetical protein
MVSASIVPFATVVAARKTVRSLRGGPAVRTAPVVPRAAPTVVAVPVATVPLAADRAVPEPIAPLAKVGRSVPRRVPIRPAARPSRLVNRVRLAVQAALMVAPAAARMVAAAVGVEEPHVVPGSPDREVPVVKDAAPAVLPAREVPVGPAAAAKPTCRRTF